MMRAVIVTIGDELLIGQIVDTNSAWMGAEISKLGFDIVKKITIHDRHDDIIHTLEEITGKVELVLITGGLGSTSDDVTKSSLCEFFNSKLIFNEDVYVLVSKMLSNRKMAMTEGNRNQANVPECCKVMMNDVGTAPGMWFEKDKTVFVSMPGVPYEMKYLMTERVMPQLRQLFTSQIIIHKNIMTYGLPESRLSDVLQGFEAELPGCIKLAYLPDAGVNKLRLTATGNSRDELQKLIDLEVQKLYSIIPRYIFAEDEKSMEEVIGELLIKKNATIGTAESCTAGSIARQLVLIPGSSNYFKGSVVAYSNSVKTAVLEVPEEVINKYGAVSCEVAELMAKGARKVLKTDYAVATSGIAGPDGGTETKPVGTVCIAVASPEKTISSRFNYGGTRTSNINRFTMTAINMLREELLG